MGGFKQELKIVDGNISRTETMELSLSCDGSKITYNETGDLLNSLHEFSEYPHDMLTV